MAFNYSYALSELNNMEEIIKTYESEDINNPIKTTVYEQYFIITLYTIWDKANTYVLQDILTKHQEIFNTLNFQYEYLNTIFSDNYLKRKLKEDIQSNQTSKNLCDITMNHFVNTNNLKYSTLMNLFKIFEFDTGNFSSYLSRSKNLNKALTDLENTPEIIDYKDRDKRLNIEAKVELYVDYIVKKRNSYSHVYQGPYSDFDISKFKKLHVFFRNLIITLDIYIKDQIINKFINYQNSNKLTKIKVKNFDILEKKKSDEQKLSIELSTDETYRLENQSKIVLINKSKKKYYDQISIFNISKIEQMTGKIFAEDSSKILYRGAIYKFTLIEENSKRTIKKEEGKDSTLFLDII